MRGRGADDADSFDADFFDEDEVPASKLATWKPRTQKAHLKVHTAQTRKLLAVIIVSFLVLLYIGAGAAFALDLVTVGELVTLIAAFSGVQTLAAAVAGFYFAAKS